MKLRFRAEDHTYWHRKQRFASVTEVLRAVGIIENSPYLKESGLTRGRYVHKMIYLEHRGRLDHQTVDERLKPYLVAWRKFLSDTGAKVLAGEQIVHSEQLMIAGTYDLMIEFPGVSYPFIFELKTNTRPIWTPAQLAFYRHLNDTQDIGIKSVTLKANGKYKLGSYTVAGTEWYMQIGNFAQTFWAIQKMKGGLK